MSPRELGLDLEEVETVRERILASISALESETLPLALAHGRVLREDLIARELLPPFDNSAMDGYGVRCSDVSGATSASPCVLRVVGSIAAGDVADSPLQNGETVRIMTGAPTPPGVEAVVPHELTTRDGNRVTFSAPIAPGKHIRPAGGDVRPGDRLVIAGTTLHSGALAVAAALGAARVAVSRVPRVAVLSPGSELVAIDRQPGPGKIRNSNAYLLTGAIRESGAEPRDLGIVGDDPRAIEAIVDLAFAEGADVLVSSGGVSAGDHDHVRDIILRRGAPGHVFRVAMRPGKPLAFGLFGGRPFIGLPGNPASARVAFEVFVRPLLRRLRGELEVLPRLFEVYFPFEFRYPTGRTFYLRARVEADPDHAGALRVQRPGSQDSGSIASMPHDDVLVVLPGDPGVVEAGERRSAFFLSSAR
jgi:molybdopterin molybdotransferase